MRALLVLGLFGIAGCQVHRLTRAAAIVDCALMAQQLKAGPVDSMLPVIAKRAKRDGFADVRVRHDSLFCRGLIYGTE